MACGADQSRLLVMPDRVFRVGVTVAGSRLDLDKNQRGPVLRDQVDLPERAAIIAFHDSVAVPFQMARSQPLAAQPQTRSFVRR